MKLPYITIRTCALCAIIALAAILSGCATPAADKKWIANRAAELQQQKKPGTDRLYTADEANYAAEAENTYATRMAAAPAIDAVRRMGDIDRGDPIRPSILTTTTAPPSMAVGHTPVVTPAAPTMSHCFVAGTPVQTPAGAREIQDIRAGDSVLSFNERSGRVEPALVTKVITGRRSDLMVLTTPHGSVTCSQNHRFLTADSRWTMAAALSASDKVLALGAGFTGVIPVKCAARHRDLESSVTVHNFEVEGNHDYFVGPDAILCHNTK